jgi:cell division transport system permease protein
MRRWLAHHRAAVLDAVRRLARTPFSSVFTILAIGVALVLPAGLYLGLLNLDRLAGELPAQPEISLFLAESTTSAERDKLDKTLAALPGIAKREFVSRDQALRRLEAQGLGDITAGLGSNPLPDAWILTPAEASPAGLEALRKDLAALPGVERVQLDSAWAERLQALLRIGERLVLLLASLFGLALVAISSNAIRAQILARRDEIEVSRLIGATDRYVRRPFLYLGALQGAGGGLMALGLLMLIQGTLAGPVSELATLYASPYRLQGFSALEGGLLLTGSLLFSLLGAWAGVSRTLHRVDQA